ncbi:MAG TPA: DUF1775 domain-containing protein [Devosia sp.]|nr:DUF1775 domain-containing protein [Devosia sp.]
MKRMLIAALATLLATPAFAHITLETQQAAPGASYKAVFRVPHGCDGAATTGLKIQIPDGFISAKPMPHPGWTIATKSGPYTKTYKLYGAEVKSGVTEVDFTGGNLPDAWYDEFVVAGTLADSFRPGDVVYFPTVQECGTAADRWIEIPAAGQKIDDLKRPAPHLEIVAAPK